MSAIAYSHHNRRQSVSGHAHAERREAENHPEAEGRERPQERRPLRIHVLRFGVGDLDGVVSQRQFARELPEPGAGLRVRMNSSARAVQKEDTSDGLSVRPEASSANPTASSRSSAALPCPGTSGS